MVPQEIALLAPSGQRSGMLTSPGQPLPTREDQIGTGVCLEAPGRVFWIAAPSWLLVHMWFPTSKLVTGLSGDLSPRGSVFSCPKLAMQKQRATVQISNQEQGASLGQLLVGDYHKHPLPLDCH